MSWLESFFLLYFILLNTGYFILNLLSMLSLWRYMESRSLDGLPQTFFGFDQPISLLVPAYNEERVVVASVRSLLQLNYPKFEIIVINDGSSDATLAALTREFALQPFPEVVRKQLPCAEIRGVYSSGIYPDLRVVDKENGGKADALNAGINVSRFPLYCGIDADSILQRDALLRVVQPFLDDPRTIAAGGTVRVANGCRIAHGLLESVGLPASWLARFQIVEYLRAFLFGRLGWSAINAVLIISGAFGLFRKNVVIEAGGYRVDTVGEDMELILRLHRRFAGQRDRYRIAYVPDPLCWTEVPESVDVLRRQRMRWQRGLADSLTMNRGLLFDPGAGAAGWLAFPFYLFFEFFGPVIETAGYALFILGFCFGVVSWEAFRAFLFVAVSFGVMLSVTALFIEEVSFRLFPRLWDVARLFVVALAENFGYRQIVALWRLLGLVRWVFGLHQPWGAMTRTGAVRSRTQDSPDDAPPPA